MNLCVCPLKPLFLLFIFFIDSLRISYHVSESHSSPHSFIFTLCLCNIYPLHRTTVHKHQVQLWSLVMQYCVGVCGMEERNLVCHPVSLRDQQTGTILREILLLISGLPQGSNNKEKTQFRMPQFGLH